MRTLISIIALAFIGMLLVPAEAQAQRYRQGPPPCYAPNGERIHPRYCAPQRGAWAGQGSYCHSTRGRGIAGGCRQREPVVIQQQVVMQPMCIDRDCGRRRRQEGRTVRREGGFWGFMGRVADGYFSVQRAEAQADNRYSQHRHDCRCGHVRCGPR